jgi:hypothetical protein
MTEPMIRGHVVTYTAGFFQKECDPEIALRVDRDLSIELRDALADMSPAGWYPRRYQVELLNVAAAAHQDQDVARKELMRCGAGLASVDNKFMQLLMKILTPELLLKKSSRFWLRDHRESGRCELDLLDSHRHTGRLRLRGVAGYSHASLVWLGWMTRVLDEICAPGAEITQQGWTWSSPAPDEVTYEVKWS